ncbi:MAG: DUF3828 domain-containing protein [Bacteroidota bacterium]
MRKSKVGLFVIVYMLLSFMSVQAQEVYSEVEIKKRLKEFYLTYMTQIESSTDVLMEQKILKKYCTRKLIAKVTSASDMEKDNSLDYDVFINAQDVDVKSLKTLVIKRETENIYRVSYVPSYNKKMKTIRLKIVKREKEYFIDDILDVKWP